MRMKEESGRSKGQLNLLKRRLHGGSPGERTRITRQGICERTENVGGVGKETVIEIHQTEETLEILERGRSRIVGDGIHVGGQRCDARAVMVWPRKERVGWAKTHLAKLTKRPVDLPLSRTVV